MFALAAFVVVAAAAVDPPPPLLQPPTTPPPKVISEGGLSREEIQREVSRFMSRIKGCYEDELTEHPNLEGKLVLHWIIDSTGAVVESRITEDTLQHPELDACVLGLVRAMHFPEPKGGGNVNVTYPFVFASSPARVGDDEGPSEVRGSLSTDEIQAVVRARSDELRGCYEVLLRTKPNAAGKLLLRWTIGATGAVVDAALDSSSINDVTLESCVVQVVLEMRFPAPRGGGVVTVHYPFVFRSGGGPDTSARPVSVTGALDKRVVVDVIAAHDAALTACVGASDAIGRVNVRFTIDAAGAVSVVKTEASSLQNAAADGCIQKTVKELVFPAAASETLVFYPLLFLPPDAPPQATKQEKEKEKVTKKQEGGCAWPW